MIGLGVMGSNLLLNMADHGFKVIGFDLNASKTAAFENSAKKDTTVKGVNTLAEMISQLKKPRKFMMLVPAGQPVDDVIHDVIPLLEEGDIIIDGGNSHYTDTLRRIQFLKDKKFHFMGIGISGGEQGARLGPSIMPGGDVEAYHEVEAILKSVAAKVEGQPCVAYLGKGAAGHFVKMVHNGIEYALMQLISECYDLLQNGLGLNNQELHNVFSDWNNRELKSFLMEITAEIFKKKDDNSSSMLIDMILDKAGAKGTGKWTSQEGLDLPVPIPTIDMAVMMRNLSSLKNDRVKASKLYNSSTKKIDTDKALFVEQLFGALYFSTIISYAQGLSMLALASKELEMEIPLPEVVRVWSGGCIIRSLLLPVFEKVFQNDGKLENILLNQEIAKLLQANHESVKQVISNAALNDYPVSALGVSLNYYNAYCREKLPVNLIQAQRDFFGAHTYQRTDVEGIYHTNWE